MSFDWKVIYDALSFTSFSFESRLLIIGLVVVIIALLFVITRIYWWRIFRKILRHPEAVPIFNVNQSIRDAGHDLMFLSKIILIVYVFVLGGRLFVERPYAYATYPAEYTRLQDAAGEIHLEFTVPVSRKDMEFHVSPETKGEWVWEDPIGGLPLYRNVKFVPHDSFYPGSTIVLYLVGMRQAWYPWQSHEQAFSFDAPIAPWVKSIDPVQGAEEVPVDTPVYISLNGPVGDFVELQYESTPRIENIQSETQGSTVVLSFPDELAQGEKYEIDIYQTPRSYNKITGRDIQRGDTREIGNVSFTTVKPPLVESFEPQGIVLPDQSLKIVFDQAMNQDSVSDHLTMTPKIDGEVIWEDDRTWVLDPAEELERDTEYLLSFSKGIKANNGGFTEQDVSISFKTIGPVQVASVTPVSGSSGVVTNGQTIAIEFNQEVDQESAQQGFTLAPQVQGTFSWNGNTMMFTPDEDFKYGTTYTYTLSPGIKTVRGLDSTELYSFHFATRQNIHTLGVPYFRQEEGFTCNVASARMVLSYRGVSLSEDDIQYGIGYGSNPNNSWVEGYGTHVDAIAGYIGQHRSVQKKVGWNVTDMLREVQAGNPVILWWYNRYSQPPGPFQLADGSTGYNGMHSEVVRGFIGDIENPTHILTNDPWRGQLQYNRALFDSTWAYMNNTALVVY